jgi:Fe2+ or Zn2+ uptake regulation protein
VTTGDGTERPTERVCKTPGCGKVFRLDPRIDYVQEKFYCGRDCRERYARKRAAARVQQAKEPLPPRPCRGCGQDFVPTNPKHETCSEPCFASYRAAYQRAYFAAEREALEASKKLPLPPAPSVCADCGKPARRSKESRGLVYCSDRCGWSVLLTARERDARADTPDPTPDTDDDQEEEAVSEEEDLDTEEEAEETEEEEAPVPQPDPPPVPHKLGGSLQCRKKVLAAVSKGVHVPIKIIEATGKGRTAVFRALEVLREQGAVVRVGVANATAYYLPGAVPADAPAPPKRKPNRDGSRTRARTANETAVLDAISAGVTGAEAIIKRVGKHPSSVYLAIHRLAEEGRVVKGGAGNRRTYTLAEQVEPTVSTGQIAPPICPPVPVAPPVAPSSLRAQIAALPPAELLALLDALEPVAAHARALRDALAGLRG